MSELDFRRMQINARRGGAAVKRVTKNGEAAFRRVDANLMRAAGQRLGVYHLQLSVAKFGVRYGYEFCLRNISAWTARVFFASTEQGGFNRERVFWCVAVRE